MKTWKDFDLKGYSMQRVRSIISELKIGVYYERLPGYSRKQRVFSEEDFKKIQNKINKSAENRDRKKVIKVKKEKGKEYKEIQCLKCHNYFETELDKMGIPYNKLCPNCHKSNQGVTASKRHRVLSGTKTF